MSKLIDQVIKAFVTWNGRHFSFHLQIFEESLFLIADIASKWLLNAAGLFHSSTQSFPTALAHTGHTYLSLLEKASICSNRRKTLNMLLLVMNSSEQHRDAYHFFRSKQSNWVPLSCLKAELDAWENSLNGDRQAAKRPTRKKALYTATLVKMLAARRRKFVKKRVFFILWTCLGLISEN